MRVETETRRFYLGRDYCEAVENFGGLPVHIGLIPKKDYIADVFKDLDGILLPGSNTDVDPRRFGQKPKRGLRNVIEEKDATEFLVLNEAEKRGLPILAICYGMQALNVWRGGTLIQDIAREKPESLAHDSTPTKKFRSHLVEIEPHTKLSRLIMKRKFRANSSHHQSVDQLGKHLKVAALTSDGIIEAIEDTRAGKFIFGFQWHPEIGWRESSESRRIFKAFIDYCVGNFS